MTVKRDIEAILESIPSLTGRNAEHDLKKLAEALGQDLRDASEVFSKEPRNTALALVICGTVGVDYFAYPNNAWPEDYALALWRELGEYLIWAVDAAAQHRQALMMMGDDR